MLLLLLLLLVHDVVVVSCRLRQQLEMLKKRQINVRWLLRRLHARKLLVQIRRAEVARRWARHWRKEKEKRRPHHLYQQVWWWWDDEDDDDGWWQPQPTRAVDYKCHRVFDVVWYCMNICQSEVEVIRGSTNLLTTFKVKVKVFIKSIWQTYTHSTVWIHAI